MNASDIHLQREPNQDQKTSFTTHTREASVSLWIVSYFPSWAQTSRTRTMAWIIFPIGKNNTSKEEGAGRHLEKSLVFCCSVSRVRLFTTSWTAAPGFPVLHYFLEFTQTHAHWCHPISSSSAIPFSSCPQSFRVFSSESTLHISWPKYWSSSFSISPSNVYSELISFKTDWFAILALQGTLKSCHQHYSLKTSVLQCSTFLMVQLSHLYMTTGKKL